MTEVLDMYKVRKAVAEVMIRPTSAEAMFQYVSHAVSSWPDAVCWPEIRMIVIDIMTTVKHKLVASQNFCFRLIFIFQIKWTGIARTETDELVEVEEAWIVSLIRTEKISYEIYHHLGGPICYRSLDT